MTRIPIPAPVDRLGGVRPYAPARPSGPIDLRLDGNEGPPPSPDLIAALADAGPEVLRRYPDARPLEAELARRCSLPPGSILLTAGADEAIDRICRAYLGPGRSLAVAVPTFEMIPRYAALAGARVLETSWPEGPFPVDALLARIEPDTAVIAVVTPNNPTGAVATASDLRRLSAGASGALLLVDLAYAEFADEDLMPVVRDLPNAVAVRSLSKAWGLAGLRVGYAAGPPGLIAPLRSAGGPYAVSGPSLLMAERALARPASVHGGADEVRVRRERLRGVLDELGARPVASQGNFVYARPRDAAWLRDGLAGLGVGVRLLADPPAVRTTVPSTGADADRLEHALRAVLAPDALLLDMDGVLADVSGSYRRCIVETVRGFGAEIAGADVAAAKRRPGSNNDWELSRRLLAERGVDVPLDEAIARFQAVYTGLAEGETLIVPREALARLAARRPLGVVTGRPRDEAEAFLARHGVADLFTVVVCLDDASAKPDPAPVRLALDRLGVVHAWMVGDTVDDVLAARAAGVVPLGVVAPEDVPAETIPALARAGAARVLTTLTDIEEVLP